MATDSTNRTYYISYGFLFGPLNGWRLRRQLELEGFRQAKSAETADIIVAHSGGCYTLPAAASPKLIMHIGMPLVRGKTVRTYLKAERGNLATYIRHGHPLILLRFFSGCFVYSLTDTKRNLAIMRRVKSSEARHFNKAQVVFVANRHDPWPHAADLETYKSSKPWAFVSLPGCHDNVWEEPSTYVDIIKRYAI